MATLKATVKTKRKDGLYVVYIRITHNRQVSYLRSSWVVNPKGVSRDKKDITDPFVLEQTSKLITHYYQMLNRIDTSKWSVKEVVKYLQCGSDDISFSDFAKEHIGHIIDEGRERTAKNYKLALQNIEKFSGINNLTFSRITSSFLMRWIDTLSNTARAKQQYPVCIREVYKSALKYYNDEDRGIELIKNPWTKVKIPKSDTPSHRAIPASLIRKFFSVIPDRSRFTYPLQEYGQDVAKICFCMCGINTVDLFLAKKEQYKDGIFWYERAKTRHSRSDNAYFEIKVPSFITPTFNKYLSTNLESPWLFKFHERLATNDSFNANVNAGIKQICEKVSPDFRASVYSFRHSWATIAQNECGASLADVDFALNHANHKMARVYTKLDYSPAWELNEKVIEFLFFSDKESNVHDDERERSFEKLSKYNMIKAEAFVMGKIVATIENTGYSNVSQVMDELMSSLPGSINPLTKVQIKITNVDKHLSRFYEKVLLRP